MGRKLRTRVPVIPSHLIPETADLEKLQQKELTYRLKQKQCFNQRHKARDMTFLRPGEHVWVKDTSEKGTVVSTAGSPRSYRPYRDTQRYLKEKQVSSLTNSNSSYDF